jgi:glyoxylase-like metal-dependent hydrolase (beta-lactamase superfamily II)
VRTTQLTPNLTQITRLGFVNAFLVREDDGFTLVDTTIGGRGADALLGAAHAAGGEVRRIALTHGHGDHAGTLDALRAKLGSSVEVLMGEADARILAGEKVVEGKLPGMWRKVETQPDVRLQGGERIGSLEVVPTPGHSPGHVSFLDTRDRSVIVGDVYTAYGRLNVTNHFYWRFPLAYGATWDRPEDLRSARMLRGLEPALLAVGHGPATRSPAAAMDTAIARSAQTVGDGAGTPAGS